MTTLEQLKLEHIESNTNFVLHRISGSLAEYSARMADNGISVGRRMTEEDGWCRLSLGTVDEMKAFSQTLRAFRDKGWV